MERIPEEGETAGEAAEAEEGETAEEAEEEEPVLEGDELEVTSSVEEDLLSNEGLINELLATAITRTGEKQFNEAFSLFDTAKDEIEKCEATPAKAVYLDRLASERKKAQILYGEEILEQAKDTGKDPVIKKDERSGVSFVDVSGLL